MAQAGTWSTPLRLLVDPLRAWDQLRTAPTALPAYIYHCLVIALTWLLNSQLYSEIAVAASIGPAKTLTSYSLFAIILQSLVSVALLLLLLAAAIWIATRLLPEAPGFRSCWSLAVNGSLPVALGWTYGSLLMFFLKPLAADALTALSFLLKPFSLGLVSMFPASFHPLSLPWFIASYLDAFGLWAVALICIGLVRFLAVPASRVLWAALTLVLLLLLLITGLWQVIQLGITSAI